jgi:hypothetical protein
VNFSWLAAEVETGNSVQIGIDGKIGTATVKNVAEAEAGTGNATSGTESVAEMNATGIEIEAEINGNAAGKGMAARSGIGGMTGTQRGQGEAGAGIESVMSAMGSGLVTKRAGRRRRRNRRPGRPLV